MVPSVVSRTLQERTSAQSPALSVKINVGDVYEGCFIDNGRSVGWLSRRLFFFLAFVAARSNRPAGNLVTGARGGIRYRQDKNKTEANVEIEYRARLWVPEVITYRLQICFQFNS